MSANELLSGLKRQIDAADIETPESRLALQNSIMDAVRTVQDEVIRTQCEREMKGYLWKRFQPNKAWLRPPLGRKLHGDPDELAKSIDPMHPIEVSITFLLIRFPRVCLGLDRAQRPRLAGRRLELLAKAVEAHYAQNKHEVDCYSVLAYIEASGLGAEWRGLGMWLSFSRIDSMANDLPDWAVEQIWDDICDLHETWYVRMQKAREARRAWFVFPTPETRLRADASEFVLAMATDISAELEPRTSGLHSGDGQ